MKFSTKIFYSIFLSTLLASLLSGCAIFFLLAKNIENEYLDKYKTISQVISNTFKQLEESADIINEIAIKLLYEIEKHQGLPSNISLIALAKDLNIKAFYVTDITGKFIRSTDLPLHLQTNSIFSYCQDYRSILSGKIHSFVTPIIPGFPYNIPMKLTMIPNHNNTLILESGIEFEYIGKILHHAIQSDNSIRSIGLFTPTGKELGFISKSNGYHRGSFNRFEQDPKFKTNTRNNCVTFSTKIPTIHAHCCECIKKNISDSEGKYFYVLQMEVSIYPLMEMVSKLKYRALLFFIVSLILGFFLSKILSKKLVSRIEKINTTATNILESKNLDLQVDVLKKNDEVSSLAQTFNQMIKALKLSQETLVKSEKSRAIANLAAQVAHDIRSPLAVMEMMLLKIYKHSSDPESLILKEAIQNVRDISNNLLIRYRQSESIYNNKYLTAQEVETEDNLYPILLSSIVEQIASQKRAEWSDKVYRLVVTILPETTTQWISASPIHIKRLLSNLLNNAFEAVQGEPRIHIRLSKTKENVILQVEDNGQGIPENKINQVLNGVSLKHIGKGLGLSSATQCLETLGGKLKISSAKGSGTTIKLFFPIINKPDWLPEKIYVAKYNSVVILDDDPSIHNYWRHRFQGINVQSFHFQNCKDVIQWKESHAKDFSNTTFLIDYELKTNNITGLTLIEKFKLKSFVYMITSHAEESSLQQYCKALNLKLIPKSLLNQIEIEKL